MRRTFLGLTMLTLACGPAEDADVPELEESEGTLYAHDRTFWPLGHVPVCFEQAGFEDERSWVRAAIDASWGRHANLSFMGWARCSADSTGIRITFGDEMVANRLGRGPDGTNRIELDVRDGMEANWSQCTHNDLGRRDCMKAVAIHEFGHGLGFAHEQNRPDTPDDCDRAPQGSNGNLTIGPWDGSSIMNYCADADVLSAGDIAGVQQVYGKPTWYVGVFEASNAEEMRSFGAPYEQHRAWYSPLYEQGWRIHTMTAYVKAGVVLRDTVLRRTATSEYRVYGYGQDALRARYDEIWPEGWRLHVLDTYVVNGAVRYDAVWKQTREAERQVLGSTEQQFIATNESLARENYRPSVVNTYFVNGAKRITAVWKQDGAGEVQLFGADLGAFQAENARRWSEGFRLQLFSAYREGGASRFNATWRRSASAQSWVAANRYGGMIERYDELRALGMRIKRLDAYQD